MSVKKLESGEGYRTCIKEDLGWTVDMEVGTVYLSERNLPDLFTFLYLTATQGRIGQKYMDWLFGKLRSTYIAVPGQVDYLYHIQHDLKKVGEGISWISLNFHW